MIRTLWFIVLVVVLAAMVTPQEFPPAAENARILEGLQSFTAAHLSVKGIHPMLEKRYPVAVLDQGRYWIYDADPGGNGYVFVKTAPAPDGLPKEIRAAFPLEAYGGRAVCVVSPSAFDPPGEVATILHEFIHCAQWECCEPDLKNRLGVAREAMKKQDYMWELTYPFPYDQAKMVKAYGRFLKAASGASDAKMAAARSKLKAMLKPAEFEYMVWQEFKEGFARYMENQIRRKLGWKEHHYAGEEPLSRISFYEGGSVYIARLCQDDPTLCTDLPRLFETMLHGGTTNGNKQGTDTQRT